MKNNNEIIEELKNRVVKNYKYSQKPLTPESGQEAKAKAYELLEIIEFADSDGYQKHVEEIKARIQG